MPGNENSIARLAAEPWKVWGLSPSLSNEGTSYLVSALRSLAASLRYWRRNDLCAVVFCFLLRSVL